MIKKKQVGCNFKTFVNLNILYKGYTGNTHYYENALLTTSVAWIDYFITMFLMIFQKRELKKTVQQRAAGNFYLSFY